METIVDELIIKHKQVIDFMIDHDGIIDWMDADITDEIRDLIFDGIPDVISSYYETETYMLNDKFDK